MLAADNDLTMTETLSCCLNVICLKNLCITVTSQSIRMCTANIRKVTCLKDKWMPKFIEDVFFCGGGGIGGGGGNYCCHNVIELYEGEYLLHGILDQTFLNLK